MLFRRKEIYNPRYHRRLFRAELYVLVIDRKLYLFLFPYDPLYLGHRPLGDRYPLETFDILYLFLNQTSQGTGVTFGAKFLNIVYPAADSLLTALAITILRTEKGIADHPNILFFVFSFIVLAAADTVFSFRSSAGIYWNGDISDLLFAVSGFLTSWGILSL